MFDKTGSEIKRSLHYERYAETGLLMVPKPFTVLLRFQNFPTWLLGLDPQLISIIYLPDYTNWSHFQRGFISHFHNPVLLEALLHLTPSKFRFDSVSKSTSIFHLYSGSIEFVNALYDDTSNSSPLFLIE